ncbi:MAG: hypothetical protein H6837_06935 [Planctomycetes bacterium]|nr:hypothetical protein [Planctomycetota bacterium]
MIRKPGFRVLKRDGRSEWLRASKLVRSIGRALAAAEGREWVVGSLGAAPEFADGDDWRAVDLTEAVLAGLRAAAGGDSADSTGCPLEDAGSPDAIESAQIADAVLQVLVATGFRQAAAAYAHAAAERARRRAEIPWGGASPIVGPVIHVVPRERDAGTLDGSGWQAADGRGPTHPDARRH